MRAIAPAKADKKLYQTIAKVDDTFGYWMGAGGSLFVFGMTSIGMASTSLLFFLLMLVPLPVFIVALLAQIYTKGGSYSWDRTLYVQAYDEYTKIMGDKSEAKALLSNVWAHEQVMSKDHTNRRECANCATRVGLLREFANTSIDSDSAEDIATAKRVLEQRRELAAIQAEVRKELGA